jgi:tripartite-type tricarboxylate transporter receptor subunit TctC
MRALSLTTFLGALALAISGPANAADYPNHEVLMVVPIEPGGIIDSIASPLAKQMQETTKQPVRVDYRPGKLTAIGSDSVAKAPGDGYTLLTNSRQIVNNEFLAKEHPFSLTKDLVPISQIATTPFVLLVNPKLPVKNVAELIQLAKSRDGGLRYANSGRGSNQQMSVELLKSMSGAPMTKLEYDGGGGALTAIVSGDSDFGIFAQGAIVEQMRDGKVRAIAVTGKERSSGLPDVPTVAESGLPGYEFTSWVGVFGPATMSPETVAAVGAVVSKAANDPAFKQLMASRGAKAIGSTPAQFKEFLASELALWGGIIAKSGI